MDLHPLSGDGMDGFGALEVFPAELMAAEAPSEGSGESAALPTCTQMLTRQRCGLNPKLLPEVKGPWRRTRRRRKTSTSQCCHLNPKMMPRAQEPWVLKMNLTPHPDSDAGQILLIETPRALGIPVPPSRL